jgi:hypothetical protein
MQDTVTRIFDNLIGRLDGPLHFRLIVQPLMAVAFAIRDGRRDSHAEHVPYLWALCTQSGNRRHLIRTGWKSVGKIFIMAIVVDTVYQFIVVRWFYPLETLLVALILAVVPYLLVRGPVNRLLRWRGWTPNERRHDYRY